MTTYPQRYMIVLTPGGMAIKLDTETGKAWTLAEVLVNGRVDKSRTCWREIETIKPERKTP